MLEWKPAAERSAQLGDEILVAYGPLKSDDVLIKHQVSGIYPAPGTQAIGLGSPGPDQLATEPLW